MPPRKAQPAKFPLEAFELFVHFYDEYSLFVHSQRAYKPRQQTGFGHPFFLSSCVRIITRHVKKYLFLHFRDIAQEIFGGFAMFASKLSRRID